MKKKNEIIVYLCFICIIFEIIFVFSVNAQDIINPNDFYLDDYVGVAVFGDKHILNISYVGGTVLNFNDVSYVLVGDDNDKNVFNDCVNISIYYKNNIISFVGEVKRWGVYNVDIQPIVKGINLDGYGGIGSWWNSSWVNMRVGNITNYENDASVFINLTYDSDMNNNFTDVRFINESNTTELFHWFENVVNGSYAHVWINISDSDDFINMYYNNSAITSFSIANNPYKTFIDFMNVSNISRFWRSGGAAGDINITSINGMVNIQQGNKSTPAVVIINLTGGMIDYVTDINFMCHNLSDLPLSNDNIFWSVRGNAGPISYVSLQRNSNLDATYLYYDAAPVLNDLIYDGYLVDTEYVSRFIVNDTSDMCYGYQYNVMYGLLGSTIKRIKTSIDDVENKYYVWDGTGTNGEFNFSVNYVKLYLNTTASISFGPQQNYTPPCGLSYSNENPTNGSYDNNIWLNLSVLVTNDGPCVGSYVNMSMWVGSTFYFQNTTSITNETVYLNNTNITYNGLFRCWVNGSSAGNQTGMWFEFYSVNVSLIDIYNEVLNDLEGDDDVNIGIEISFVFMIVWVLFAWITVKEKKEEFITLLLGSIGIAYVGFYMFQNISLFAVGEFLMICLIFSGIGFARLFKNYI